MKKYGTHIAAVLFLIASVIFIAQYQPFHHFLPAQQVELSHGVEYGAVVKDFLFVQEITMQKRFLSRVDLYMAKLPSTYSNENVFLLLDEQHRILYTKRFSSDDFGEALYFRFDFRKQFDIGKGKKVFACIYSIDGDQGSYIGLAKKENSNLGKLYVLSIVNNDIVRSFEEQRSLVNFTGSIGARTFETDTQFFSPLQILSYILAAAIALLIFFRSSVVALIRRTRIAPEYAFVGFAPVFGMIILVVNPPFMVPDEPVHFYRSYQVSEFNLFKIKDDFPKSLVELSDICNRMQFSTHEKTSKTEILSLGNIKTRSAERTSVVTPDYTFPYIPQAIGIFIGRMLGMSPLWLFYLGRLFNLLTSIFLIFLAIRIIPVFKWVFFLLGIMPMTLYQLASLSYDAVTIGFSFLFLATVLAHARSSEKLITLRETMVLFLLAILLAAAKQPYVVVVLTFFVIPVQKFGSIKRYLVVFSGLLLAGLVVSQLWLPGRFLAEKLSLSAQPAPGITELKHSGVWMEEEMTGRSLHASMLPLLPHVPEMMNAAQEQAVQQPAAVRQEGQPQPNDATPANVQAPINPIDAVAQKNFILNDPVRYTGILIRTLGKSANLYLTSFVGLFGWIDTPLPATVAYGFLLFLLLFSALGIEKGRSIGFLQKCIFAGVLIIAYALIETALYVYCNPVGCDPITAVQGRYFIAVGPLLFFLFASPRAITYLFGSRSLEGKQSAGKKRSANLQRQPDNTPELLINKAMPWIGMLVATFTLLVSVYVILERFYVLTF